MNSSSTVLADLGSEQCLSDLGWENILQDIRDGKVIPVIGPEMVTVPDWVSGKSISLYQFLAPPLPPEVREAFRAHLLKTAPRSWKDAVFRNN